MQLVDDWRRDSNGFLRAWAYDALYVLLSEYPQSQLDSVQVIQDGLDDPGAAVRKRMQKRLSENP